MAGHFRNASFAQASENPVSVPKTTVTSDKLRGSIKEAIGKLVGDPQVEADGRSQQKLPKSDVKPKTTSKP